MTMHQWLTHLWCWLRNFPLPRADDHCYTGIAGSGRYQCLICGGEMVEEEEGEDEL